MDGFGTVAAEQREVMHFTGRTGFDHQTGAGTQTLLDQMLVDGGGASSAGMATLFGATLRSERSGCWHQNARRLRHRRPGEARRASIPSLPQPPDSRYPAQGAELAEV